MKRAGRIAVALAVLTALVAGWSASAFAATAGPEDTAWWSKAQQAPSPAPTVPINQATGSNLMDGNDPSGPNAITAVRYTVPGTIDGEPVDASTASGTLTLKVAATGAVGTPVVEACPIISSWQAAQGGEWASRPKYNCATAAKGVFNADSTVATFALGPGLQTRPGVFDLAIVPDPANQTPFSVQFAPPGGDSLTVRAAGAPAPADESAAAGAPVADTGTTSDSGLSPDLAAPVPGLSVTPSGAPATTDTTVGSGGGGAKGTTSTLALATPIRRFSDKRGQRALGFVLLVLLGASRWWFGGPPVRRPRLLGSLGADAEGDGSDEQPFVAAGGIGRFARPRTERPPRL